MHRRGRRRPSGRHVSRCCGGARARAACAVRARRDHVRGGAGARSAPGERRGAELQGRGRARGGRSARADSAGTERAASATRAPTLAASSALLGDTGSLPAVGFGLSVGLDVAWPSLELRGLGTLRLDREGRVGSSAGTSAGAEIGLLAFDFLACVPFATRSATLAVAACAGWELGRLTGTGVGVDLPRTASAWWSAPRADLLLRWALPARWSISRHSQRWLKRLQAWTSSDSRCRKIPNSRACACLPRGRAGTSWSSGIT